MREWGWKWARARFWVISLSTLREHILCWANLLCRRSLSMLREHVLELSSWVFRALPSRAPCRHGRWRQQCGDLCVGSKQFQRTLLPRSGSSPHCLQNQGKYSQMYSLGTRYVHIRNTLALLPRKSRQIFSKVLFICIYIHSQKSWNMLKSRMRPLKHALFLISKILSILKRPLKHAQQSFLFSKVLWNMLKRPFYSTLTLLIRTNSTVSFEGFWPVCVCVNGRQQLAVGGLTLFFLSFFFLFCQGRTGSWLLGLAHADHCGEGMDLPAVFTRVSSSLQWIRATLPELSVYPEQFDMTLEFSALGLPEGECQ